VLYYNSAGPNFSVGAFGDTSANACDTAVYYSPPCAYAITYTAWGGVAFQVKGGSLSTAGYKALLYKLNTNGQPITDFGALMTYASGGGAIKEIALSSSMVKPLANGWVLVAIPVAQLNPSNAAVGTIQLKNEVNATLQTVRYDDVVLAS
jgi:hypothetical protein